LAATVVVPPNTGPALKMLVQAARDRSQPPEQTLVAPYSFPDLNELASRDFSDPSDDGWK
jgi:hypothetical protein